MRDDCDRLATPCGRDRAGLVVDLRDVLPESRRPEQARHVVADDATRQVSSRPPSRLVSQASAPEFVELSGNSCALVVTGSSGGRRRRRIHRIDRMRRGSCYPGRLFRICCRVRVVRRPVLQDACPIPRPGFSAVRALWREQVAKMN